MVSCFVGGLVSQHYGIARYLVQDRRDGRSEDVSWASKKPLDLRAVSRRWGHCSSPFSNIRSTCGSIPLGFNSVDTGCCAVSVQRSDLLRPPFLPQWHLLSSSFPASFHFSSPGPVFT